jgi:outer membrane protein assembly factor BamD
MRQTLHGSGLFLALLALGVAGGCASSGRGAVPPGTLRPDQFLYDRGMEELNDENWLTAREFFKQVTETYTQSPLRPDAKLAIGDTYLGESTAEAYVLALNEFQEFLAFYPTHPRGDYAQYKMGMAHFRQMRGPQRDQTETRAAIKDFEAFLVRFPNSSLTEDVRAKLREARDRIATWHLEVGVHYFRQRWYPGAIDRLQVLLKEDPEFSLRDGVYFYLGESLMRVQRGAEALPLFERLVAEFEQSEYLADARKRIAELKAQIDQQPGGQKPKPRPSS